MENPNKKYGKRLDKNRFILYTTKKFRGVAKFGIALGSGPRGRGFESRHSDQRKILEKPMFFKDFSYFKNANICKR